jgi:isoleucyl-tRNA synthetase
MTNTENTQLKSAQALREEVVLKFWQEQNIFQKTLTKSSPKGEYVFYEGPPTANAKPALHHLESRAFKDVIPRYKTMQGYHVPRRAGWDTHGLPVELQIEKKLGLSSKKEIEQYGVAQFNKECKDSVFTYIKDWEVFTDRIGYWLDKKNAYYTFNTNYIESLWSIVGHINEQELLYKDYKVLPWCPRCGTALSSHELGQPGAYQDDKDLTVTAKFKIKGVDNGYFLAWTTTPWTLPGNVALAVGKDIVYVEAKVGDDIFVLAKDRLEVLTEAYEIVAEHTGSEMVGMEYEMLYPYLFELCSADQKMVNAFKVYAADFVTTDTGTGIVHIAPMYGVDDFDLGTKESLPKYHTVDDTGHFVVGTDFLQGRFAKDEEVAIDIIKDLAHRGLLFKKEKYEHSYPHCWRCKTALLYYARDSWYIGMSKLRDPLVKANEEIHWEPNHIKEGRFGEWLDNIKDWAISRERYWGTPLPVWVASDGKRLIVDSIATLKKYTKKSGNTYFVIRHGQADHNLSLLWNCDPTQKSDLTEEGILQVQHTAGAFDDTIDVVITSPFDRTKQTARVFLEAKQRTIPIETDDRLSEWNVGKEYSGTSLENYFSVRNSSPDRYNFKSADGESYIDVMIRAAQFIYDIEKKYQGKKILIVTHGGPARAIELISQGFSYNTLFETTRAYQNFNNAELRHIDFVPLPHNDQFELDLHRPYIDAVVLEKDAIEYRRTKEVMDVWFDSGAMPFAQAHYPFESAQGKSQELAYPADFISEAIDQTRGWFYTMHAIGVLMGKGKAYKNVICLGHLLDAQGKKMSKSIGNIVDPISQIDIYGVDTLRFWMYSVTQPGDSKNYDEKVVKEMQQKIFGLLYNVLAFYELYRDPTIEDIVSGESTHILDRWIVTRLHQLTVLVTENLDTYKIFEAARGFRDFIDDFSTWYLRRSRDRVKDGDVGAKQTMYQVYKTLAQLMAPFAPFAAEDIWQKLKSEIDVESVHLSEWPKSGDIDHSLLQDMEKVREFCTIGNALRKKENIPVRQPLAKFIVQGWNLSDKFKALVMDELNVKDVVTGEETLFDTYITPELKKEGTYRELVRAVQDMRKNAGLEPSDTVVITISLNTQELLTQFIEEFKKTVQAREVIFSDNEGGEAKIDEMVFKITIDK